MLRKLVNVIRTYKRHDAAGRDGDSTSRRKCRFELLENRRLLSINWANEFDAANQFNDTYGSNALIARQLVNRAIEDWEAIISDFNFDGDQNPLTNLLNNTFTLNIFAAELTPGNRGVTPGEDLVFSSGRPIEATILLDDNGDGSGWFFDQTPHDDAEFTAIVNSGHTGVGPAFQGSFIDVAQ